MLFDFAKTVTESRSQFLQNAPGPAAALLKVYNSKAVFTDIPVAFGIRVVSVRHIFFMSLKPSVIRRGDSLLQGVLSQP